MSKLREILTPFLIILFLVIFGLAGLLLYGVLGYLLFLFINTIFYSGEILANANWEVVVLDLKMVVFLGLAGFLVFLIAYFVNEN